MSYSAPKRALEDSSGPITYEQATIGPEHDRDTEKVKTQLTRENTSSIK
jgi:hypothetical protein